MEKQFRPPAVPLVTVDPYFNVWSMADRLYDDYTRHWTGKINEMFGAAIIDGNPWVFAGKMKPGYKENLKSIQVMGQESVEVFPLSTRYTFNGGGITLILDFTTPLLLDNLDILSRPVTYVSFKVVSNDGLKHKVDIYFDVTGEWCVNTTDQKVVCIRKQINENVVTMSMGTKEQPVLKRMGDDVRIDWGYFHLVIPDSCCSRTFMGTYEIRKEFILNPLSIQDHLFDKPVSVKENNPVMVSVTSLGMVGETPVSAFLILAYDDIHSIDYFGEKLNAYWRRKGITFEQMLLDSIEEYSSIVEMCNQFNRDLINRAMESGGEKYADILSLAYRQAIAAHKLTTDKNGNILFFSKENFSNGCMATVDVSYPSMPLFLLYNPELVKGMMRPIFRYASSYAWLFKFAPHDVGRYPKAYGQYYYSNSLEYQMPVEECGNMLIMAAAVCLAEGKSDFFEENRRLLKDWADFLLEKGLDPENQLCTDDFAGHLSHNANLSIKAIMGIASYSILCRINGEPETADEYLSIAKEMAREWERKARDDDHYKLAFDADGTWSLKYNLVWDRIFNLNIFPDSIVKKELEYYLTHMNTYGVPLDNRETYTKSDWLIWVASLTDNKTEFERFVEPIWHYLNETLSRVPFSDWYDTESARQIGFQNRSVQGGLFIKLLMDRKFS